MLKNLSKRISMVLICSSLVLANAMPVFASTPTDPKPLIATSTGVKTTLATSNGILTDGGSSTQTATSVNYAIFTVNPTDSNLRNITVSSSVPVKTIILPQNSAYSSFISYDSGDFRIVNNIGWHFIPGIACNVLVLAQSQTPVNVTVSMSQSSGALTWVNDAGPTSITEKNIITGGQTDQYGFGFTAAGTYLVTVSSVGPVTLNYINALNSSENSIGSYLYGTQWSKLITVTAPPTGSNQGTQSNYVLMLTGKDSVGNGGVYTITVSKY